MQNYSFFRTAKLQIYMSFSYISGFTDFFFQKFCSPGLLGLPPAPSVSYKLRGHLVHGCVLWTCDAWREYWSSRAGVGCRARPPQLLHLCTSRLATQQAVPGCRRPASWSWSASAGHWRQHRMGRVGGTVVYMSQNENRYRTGLDRWWTGLKSRLRNRMLPLPTLLIRVTYHALSTCKHG